MSDPNLPCKQAQAEKRCEFLNECLGMALLVVVLVGVVWGAFSLGQGSSVSISRASQSLLRQGDAAIGEQLFASNCASCHGSTGEGMPQQGVKLHGSSFLRRQSDAQIYVTIRDGRQTADRFNLTGRVMPARGGNPRLTDQDVADLVRYVRSAEFQK